MKRLLLSMFAIACASSALGESLVVSPANAVKLKPSVGWSVQVTEPMALNDLIGSSVGLQVYVSGTVAGIGDVSGLIDLKVVGVATEEVGQEDEKPNAKTIFLKVEQPTVSAPQAVIASASPHDSVMWVANGIQLGCGFVLALVLIVAGCWIADWIYNSAAALVRWAVKK